MIRILKNGHNSLLYCSLNLSLIDALIMIKHNCKNYKRNKCKLEELCKTKIIPIRQAHSPIETTTTYNQNGSKIKQEQ